MYTSVSSIHAKIRTSKTKKPKLDKLDFNSSNLQENSIDVIRLKKLMKKKKSCVFDDNNILMNVDNCIDRGKSIS